ncbi:mCG146083, partial [Mus musculus]
HRRTTLWSLLQKWKLPLVQLLTVCCPNGTDEMQGSWLLSLAYQDRSFLQECSHKNIHNRRQKLLWGSQKTWASCFSSPSSAVSSRQHKVVLNQEASTGMSFSIIFHKPHTCHVRAGVGLDLMAPDDLL